MNKLNHDTPGFLRDRLSDAQLPVDPALWSAISSQLPAAGAASGAATSGAAASKAGLGLLAKLGISGAALLTVGVLVFALTGGWDEPAPSTQPTNEIAGLSVQETPDQSPVDAPAALESAVETSENEVAIVAEERSRGANERSTPVASDTAPSSTSPTGSVRENTVTAIDPQSAPEADVQPRTHPAVQAENPKTPQAPKISFHAEIGGFDDLEVRFMPLVDATNTVTWDFGDGQSSQQHAPDHRYETPGEYTVTLTVVGADGEARMVQDLVQVYPESKVVLPNIFTPNGDGMNDVLYLHADSKHVTLVRMLVLDAQGNTVFEQLGEGIGWDGNTLQGEPAQEGNYRLIVVAQGANGQQYNESGIVRLQR